jgi:hypothetical protein
LRLYHNYKIAFLHINRCGGTSATAFLDKFLDSENVEDLKPIHGSIASKYKRIKNFKEFRVFANVRNPFERLRSIYCYRKLYRRMDINEFIKWKYCTPGTSHPNRAIAYYLHIKGVLPSNLNIIRLEDALKEWPKIIKSICGKNAGDFPKENASDRIKLKSRFNDESIEIISKNDKWVLKNFYSDIKI